MEYNAPGDETGHLLWRLLLSLLILSNGVIVAVADPIKVFLLAGQSNMVGHGSIDHLDLLMGVPEHEYRNALWNGTHYMTRPNVYVKFGTRHGVLTVHRTAGFAAPQDFGPEVMIGVTLGDAMAPSNGTILLLKTAYGGRSLAVDFRPPSAGIGNNTEVTDPSFYGWQYREMIQEIQVGLANLPAYMPGYTATNFGYELCGFIWFQGWNDVIDWAKVYEYESNLQHFIRDVRRDLHVPNLPFGTSASFACGIVTNLVSVSYKCSDFPWLHFPRNIAISGGRVGHDGHGCDGIPLRASIGVAGRATSGLCRIECHKIRTDGAICGIEWNDIRWHSSLLRSGRYYFSYWKSVG